MTKRASQSLEFGPALNGGNTMSRAADFRIKSSMEEMDRFITEMEAELGLSHSSEPPVEEPEDNFVSTEQSVVSVDLEPAQIELIDKVGAFALLEEFPSDAQWRQDMAHRHSLSTQSWAVQRREAYFPSLQ